jgi:hypothetical protein
MLVVYAMEEIEKVEKAYWNYEVSKDLEIGESTLRKWCIELERNGYTFIKGAMDSRAFTDHDLAALNHFKQLIKKKKHTKEQAAKLVVEKFKREGGNERTTPIPMDNTRSIENLELMIKDLLSLAKKQEEINNDLLERTKNQNEFNKILVQKLDQQEKFIKESIEKRDKLLLENIRSSQEQAAANEKKKTSWIKRIFGGVE